MKHIIMFASSCKVVVEPLPVVGRYSIVNKVKGTFLYSAVCSPWDSTLHPPGRPYTSPPWQTLHFTPPPGRPYTSPPTPADLTLRPQPRQTLHFTPLADLTLQPPRQTLHFTPLADLTLHPPRQTLHFTPLADLFIPTPSRLLS